LLSWYVANFGSYNATYGSLGAVIGFMVWMWLSTIAAMALTGPRRAVSVEIRIDHGGTRQGSERSGSTAQAPILGEEASRFTALVIRRSSDRD
jgi:hypothetical protein